MERAQRSKAATQKIFNRKERKERKEGGKTRIFNREIRGQRKSPRAWRLAELRAFCHRLSLSWWDYPPESRPVSRTFAHPDSPSLRSLRSLRLNQFSRI